MNGLTNTGIRSMIHSERLVGIRFLYPSARPDVATGRDEVGKTRMDAIISTSDTHMHSQTLLSEPVLYAYLNARKYERDPPGHAGLSLDICSYLWYILASSEDMYHAIQ